MSIRNTLLVLLFGGITGALLLREQQLGTLEPLDRAHREFLKANPDPSQSHRPVPEPTVVLARMDDIDQPNKVFAGWPLTPADWQIILQNLPGYEPKTVVLSAPLPAGPPVPALEAAAKGVPGLLVSVQTSTIAGDGAKELPPGLSVLTVRGNTAAVPAFTSLNLPALPGIPGVERIDFAPKERRLTVDGDTCRLPMLARMGENVVPSLALRALMEWAQVSPGALNIQMGVAITAGTRLRIPIDEAGFFRFYLSLAPQVPSVNADEFVLTRQVPGAPAPGMPATAAAEKTKGSLLWVGYDDKASRHLKLPNGSPVSPAELTARAIAAIQTGAFMRPLDHRQQWLPPAATLLFCLWLVHWRKTWLWLGALLAAALLAAASLYLYHERQEWMPIGPGLGIIATTTLLAFILPPAPRRGKPAIIPGTRTRTQTRTSQQPAALPASPPQNLAPEAPPQPIPATSPSEPPSPDQTPEPDPAPPAAEPPDPAPPSQTPSLQSPEPAPLPPNPDPQFPDPSPEPANQFPDPAPEALVPSPQSPDPSPEPSDLPLQSPDHSPEPCPDPDPIIEKLEASPIREPHSGRQKKKKKKHRR